LTITADGDVVYRGETCKGSKEVYEALHDMLNHGYARDYLAECGHLRARFSTLLKWAEHADSVSSKSILELLGGPIPNISRLPEKEPL